MARLRLAACVALLASCGSSPSPTEPAPRPASVVKSNVSFADYAGSKACAGCHAEHAASFERSPMHNMTRAAAGATVRAPFDGTEFHFHDDVAKLETAGRDRFVTLTSKRFGSGVYRLTRIIGGHHREDYAGVLVASVKEGAPAVGDETEERVLPVSYVYEGSSLRYKGYSVMVKEREGLRIGAVWNQTCIFCHNTVPYFSTVLGALAGSGTYQGEVVDPLLPKEKRAAYVVKDEHALERELAAEMKRLGAPGKPTLANAIAGTRARFRAGQLVELGIGCESCHLGSAAHVKDPSVRPSFEPRSDAFAVTLAKPSRAETTNRVCARCHQVLFSGYDPTWEGGSRRGRSGGSHINSGEARDMMLGGCASRLSCTDCHDPHAHDGAASLERLEPAKKDALCTKCHDRYAAPEALRAHSHHDPAGEGSRCVNCHMPKKNMSLDGKLSRYHRIGSPTDPSKVLLDRPMECALCHADRDVRSLAEAMETWWKRSYERGALEKLYGSLDANVALATAERGKPHEQAVAFQLLGDARMRPAVPVLAGQLTHPYPIVRGYAKRALDAILGPVPIDLDAPDDVIAEQAKKLR